MTGLGLSDDKSGGFKHLPCSEVGPGKELREARKALKESKSHRVGHGVELRVSHNFLEKLMEQGGEQISTQKELKGEEKTYCYKIKKILRQKKQTIIQYFITTIV